MRSVWPLVICVALALPAHGKKLRHRVSLAAGGEVTEAANFGGHGFGLLRYDLEGLAGNTHLAVELNSDTVRVTYDRIRYQRLELGVAATGEVLIAGVLSDYWRDGRSDGARGFWASYVQAGGFAKIHAAPHYLELAVSGRKWFFNRATDTDVNLTLPPDAWVGEFRLRYTLWKIESEPSLWQPHRLFPRVRGFGFGVEVGVDQRSEAQPWGARAATFDPIDPRNNPLTTIVMLRQWLRAGTQLHRRVRVQLAETASFMWGEDDLQRQRVGGMNPYVVPIAGAPWAAYLSGRFAAAEASLHVLVHRENEVGVLFDGAILEDADRRGPLGHPGAAAGVGAFADLRLGAWQVDLRAGWSPTLQPGSVAGGVSVFASAGRAWTR